MGGHQEGVVDPALPSKLLEMAWARPGQPGRGAAGEPAAAEQPQFGVRNIRFK